MLGPIPCGWQSNLAAPQSADYWQQMNACQAQQADQWLQSAMANAHRPTKAEPRFRSIKPASRMTEKQVRLLIAGGAISHRSPA
jgi:poly(3-hydroxybutyrate) depolymerase